LTGILQCGAQLWQEHLLQGRHSAVINSLYIHNSLPRELFLSAFYTWSNLRLREDLSWAWNHY
jgi:hypothetical protein